MKLRPRLYPYITRISAFLFVPLTAAIETINYRLAVWFAYVPRGDDIFVVSYPKAGTTVMQMMLYQLASDGNMNIPHIDSVAPWFESAITKGPHFVEQLRSPRIFKTHRPITVLPKTARCIYVIRNPKDTCVSYYHHLTSLHGMNSPMSHFVAAFIKGRVKWGSWFTHIRSCMAFVEDPRILTVTYEELISDTGTVIDKVSAFCGFTPTESKRLDVIAKCSLSYMKFHNAKFDPRFAGLRIDRTDFIRKGMSGDWVNSLTPRFADQIDRALTKAVKQLSAQIPNRDMSFLKSVKSNLRGTLHASLVLESGDHYIGNLATDKVPSGVFLARQEMDNLAVGDLVRLRLSSGRVASNWITVDIAKVTDVGKRNGRLGLTLAFTHIDAGHTQQLKRHWLDTSSGSTEHNNASDAQSEDSRQPKNQAADMRGLNVVSDSTSN